MKVFIGSDHGGYMLKEILKGVLENGGYEVIDEGNNQLDENDDYVDFGVAVTKKVLENPDSRGVVLCKNGMGMSIVANRFKGVRCGLAFNAETTRRGRRDDDINILSLPAEYINEGQAVEMVKVFLTEKFGDEERYLRRINKLELI